MNYFLLLLNISFLLSGQMMWKFSVGNIQKWDIHTVFSLLKSPLFLGGGFSYTLATFLWVYILSKMPFSVAYPFQSLTYVLGMVVAYFIFKEHIDLQQWMGIGIVMIGILLIAK